MNYIKTHYSWYDKLALELYEHWTEYAIGVLIGIIIALYFI